MPKSEGRTSALHPAFEVNAAAPPCVSESTVLVTAVAIPPVLPTLITAAPISTVLAMPLMIALPAAVIAAVPVGAATIPGA